MVTAPRQESQRQTASFDAMTSTIALLNNLMQALMAMSTLMRLRDDYAGIGRISTDIESLIRRGSGLTQQLLLLSRDRPIEKGALDLGVGLRKAGESHLMPEKRLLLLEDDLEVREGLCMLLEWVGYEVVLASSGEEALALAIDPPPALLLSDVTLPGIGGPDTAKRLRERWPELKVVLMSGYANEAVLATAREQAWHFLQKPFDLADLENVLRIALLDVVA